MSGSDVAKIPIDWLNDEFPRRSDSIKTFETRFILATSDSNSTCWTLIEHAATGEQNSSARFVTMYRPVIQGFLAKRWKGSKLASSIEDAIQDVMIECFRPKGILQKADPQRANGFRVFLYGVVRNVALRYESRRRPEEILEEPLDDQTGISLAFEKAFARAIMREASRLQLETATAEGPDALRRFELLRLRFEENLPIREIATQWSVDAAWLHHQYATARQEFRQALQQVVAFHNPQALPSEIGNLTQEILAALL